MSIRPSSVDVQNRQSFFLAESLLQKHWWAKIVYLLVWEELLRWLGKELQSCHQIRVPFPCDFFDLAVRCIGKVRGHPVKCGSAVCFFFLLYKLFFFQCAASLHLIVARSDQTWYGTAPILPVPCLHCSAKTLMVCAQCWALCIMRIMGLHLQFQQLLIFQLSSGQSLWWARLCWSRENRPPQKAQCWQQVLFGLLLALLLYSDGAPSLPLFCVD